MRHRHTRLHITGRRRRSVDPSSADAVPCLATSTRPAPPSSFCPECETLRLVEEAFNELVNAPSDAAIIDALMADDDLAVNA